VVGHLHQPGAAAEHARHGCARGRPRHLHAPGAPGAAKSTDPHGGLCPREPHHHRPRRGRFPDQPLSTHAFPHQRHVWPGCRAGSHVPRPPLCALLGLPRGGPALRPLHRPVGSPPWDRSPSAWRYFRDGHGRCWWWPCS
jgi:hypothetical protein